MAARGLGLLGDLVFYLGASRNGRRLLRWAALLASLGIAGG